MICDGCGNRAICKFYKPLESIQLDASSVLSINGTCNYKTNKTVDVIEEQEINEEKDGTALEDAMNAVFNLEAKSQKVQPINEIPVGLMACENCGKEVPECEITEDLRTRMNLCPECYEKTGYIQGL